MPDVSPDPKPSKRPGARTRPRRTFRKHATRSEWAEILALKAGPCRVCGRSYVRVSYHHLVPRSLGGDDVAPNIVPLCGDGTTGCHERIEARHPVALRMLFATLATDERGYLAETLGVDWARRAFGV